jgi:hypothetical protein
MKPGDKVVCIHTNRHDGMTAVLKGKIYTIINILHCSCGFIAYNVGIFDPSMIGYQTCRHCGRKHYTDNIWYQDARRFVSVQWDDCREELINEVLETKAETIKEPQHGSQI